MSEEKAEFKAYVVMAYAGNSRRINPPYYAEGWSIIAESDTFQEAVKEREDWMGKGNSRVQIFKPVHLVVTELEE